MFSFFFQAEDGIRDTSVTGVQTCALPIFSPEPNALVLLNPAFGCPPGQSSLGAPCAVMASWKVTKGGPPAILFYGTEDRSEERRVGKECSCRWAPATWRNSRTRRELRLAL